jgi:hypothetical protein
MVSSELVRQRVEQYFGDTWIFHILTTGGWSTITEFNDIDSYSDIFIRGKEIRVYPIKTNRELAIRLAVWDYKYEQDPGKNRDDMYIRTEEDLAMIPILLDKFFG